MGQILDLFERGGSIMYPIFLLSVYTTAVIIFKLYQFYRLQALNPLFVEQIENNIDLSALKRHLASARLDTNPVAKVMFSALVTLDKPGVTLELARDEIKRVGAAELRYLESHMRGLEMVANVSPLLGLLGTVVGMVDAFSVLETAGSHINPSLLAGGIWTALLTTVAGLTVAIPALIAYSVFDSRIEQVRAGMMDVAVRVLALKEQRRATRIAPTSHRSVSDAV